MSDILDDWFGFDPPPEVPEARTPVTPAPTRRVRTTQVTTGVDATRRFTGRIPTGGESQPTRTSIIGEDEDEGIGINV